MTKNLGLLVLRLSVGASMLFAHGMPKLLSFEKLSAVFPDPLGAGSKISLILAIFSEVFCSAALMLGIKTKWITIPLMVTMFVAIFIVHGADPWAKKELAFMYLAAYTTLFLTGPGKFSLDSRFGNS